MPKEPVEAKDLNVHEIGRYAGEPFKSREYERAWKIYSYREACFYGEKGRNLGIPPWQGESLQGKTISLGYEQTLGEQIMFSSILPDVAREGGNAVIEVDKRLVTLIQRSFPSFTVVPWEAPWNTNMYSGDYYALLGNLGTHFRTTDKSFLTPQRWLVSDTNKVAKIPDSKAIIGISWWSPASYDGDTKSIPLDDFASVHSNRGVTCVDLQYGRKLLNDSMYRDKSVDLTYDIDRVASLIDQCDLVITISNTVAHLAGALGKDTYLLMSNNKARHWYWDTLFYPTVKRVEKQKDTLWSEIIAQIVKKVVDT